MKEKIPRLDNKKLGLDRENLDWTGSLLGYRSSVSRGMESHRGQRIFLFLVWTQFLFRVFAQKVSDSRYLYSTLTYYISTIIYALFYVEQTVTVHIVLIYA